MYVRSRRLFMKESGTPPPIRTLRTMPCSQNIGRGSFVLLQSIRLTDRRTNGLQDRDCTASRDKNFKKILAFTFSSRLCTFLVLLSNSVLSNTSAVSGQNEVYRLSSDWNDNRYSLTCCRAGECRCSTECLVMNYSADDTYCRDSEHETYHRNRIPARAGQHDLTCTITLPNVIDISKVHRIYQFVIEITTLLREITTYGITQCYLPPSFRLYPSQSWNSI